jgi:hypothetical protein
LAIKLQGGHERYLVDPTERDPLIATRVRDAHAEAEGEAGQSGVTGRGRCHFVWALQAKILADRHGITWFSPKQMNPDIFFD